MPQPSAPAAAVMAATGSNPDKTNYRTMGKGTGGVDTTAKSKRMSFRDYGLTTTSSIPTKYEVVLYKDNKENKGFSNSAPRFGSSRSSQSQTNPGPTAEESYHRVLPTDTTATGLRGQGALASRTPRFKLPTHSVSPGPGSYDSKKPLGASDRDQHPTACFRMPEGVNLAALSDKPSPGPGTYFEDSDKAAYSARGPKSNPGVIIGTEGQRHEFYRSDWAAKGWQNPGPGEYEVEASKANERQHSSALRRGTEKRPGASSSTSTGATVYESTLLRQGMQALAGGPAAIADAASAQPGPGHYSPKAEDLAKGSFSTAGTSSFQLGLSQFPRKYRPTNPGPGHYEPLEPPEQRPTGVPFHSDMSSRFKDAEKASPAPGPAYYNPQLPEAVQSFHLNAQKNWVC